jgi:hypothetical protein
MVPAAAEGGVECAARAARPALRAHRDLMAITLQHERNNVFRVEVRGVLRTADLEHCQRELAGEMDRIGPVRLLFVLEEFGGWEPGGWNDLSFYVGRGDSVERIAIVGPERWRSESLMFAGADLRRAPVEFFDASALASARTWLES